MITLTKKELLQAVKEWLEKRGVPSIKLEDISILARLIKGNPSSLPSTDTDHYDFNAQVRGVDLPPKDKEHPYR